MSGKDSEQGRLVGCCRAHQPLCPPAPPMPQCRWTGIPWPPVHSTLHVPRMHSTRLDGATSGRCCHTAKELIELPNQDATSHTSYSSCPQPDHGSQPCILSPAPQTCMPSRSAHFVLLPQPSPRSQIQDKARIVAGLPNRRRHRCQRAYRRSDLSPQAPPP